MIDTYSTSFIITNTAHFPKKRALETHWWEQPTSKFCYLLERSKQFNISVYKALQLWSPSFRNFSHEMCFDETKVWRLQMMNLKLWYIFFPSLSYALCFIRLGLWVILLIISFDWYTGQCLASLWESSQSYKSYGELHKLCNLPYKLWLCWRCSNNTSGYRIACRKSCKPVFSVM